MSSTDAARLTLEKCVAGSDSLLALWHDFLSDRLPHALLFTGDSGVGKRTLSHLLAQGLLCSSSAGQPCGECKNCRRFANEKHPNAFFPRPAAREKTIKIDSLRDVLDALSRHAIEQGRRVIVIDNAERMTPQAQNCLLKTLEEAAPDTFFLLTADAESQILPTIRSRCRVVRLPLWTKERVKKELLARGLTQEEGEKLSVVCGGRIGRALQLQGDKAYWETRDKLKKSFYAIRSEADIASAANALKNEKDNTEQILAMLEQDVGALLRAVAVGEKPDAFWPEQWLNASEESLMRIMRAVVLAQKQKQSFVGWAALSEGLMQTIAEEAKQWQK